MAEDYVYKFVNQIGFGVLGPEEIQKMSTVKIVTVSFAVTFSFESQSGCEGKPAWTAACDGAGNMRNSKKNKNRYFIRDTRYKILYTP